ncbi:MAG TPA: phytanoyl-CoA dioxygenase family protein [Myxococcota bacterium]|nr:phytanoyl-CoA dioxygenase family protein [Myxococcota bacterium]
MAVEHLSPDSGSERAAEVLARDGCVVIDGLAPRERLARFRAEIAPWLDATAPGRDGFVGKHTRRTGGLVARSPAARELVMDPLVLATTKRVLAHATTFHLHLTQVIAIGPGETPQPIHRDQWAFDFFPFPKGFEVQCNTLWALTDFTERNGATRVIPGSHRFDDKLELTLEDTEPAEMEAGSVLLYTGALYHGGGPNRSDAVRAGINITYALSWLRQEENQYLTVPPELARELPDDLCRMLGYARGAYALGYVDDLRDPLDALRGKAASGDAFGTLEQIPERLRRNAGLDG